MALRTIDDLRGLLGSDSEAVVELQQLFNLAEGYGCESCCLVTGLLLCPDSCMQELSLQCTALP